MKFWKIFSFEFSYQLRTVSTWIFLGIAFLFPLFFSAIGQSSDEAVFLNAPSFLIFITVFASVIWLITSGAIAGHAGTRDIQTKMHPLTFTLPVSKAKYLGGRFLAAFLLNALIHLSIPIAFFLSFHIRTVDPGQLGPFRPEAFLTTYFYLSLPLAFVATACQFAGAVLERSAIVAYIASILLFPIAFPLIGTVAAKLAGNWELVKLIDPVGFSIAGTLDTWTPFEKNNRVIELEGMFLWNRFMWLSIALALLAFTYYRFQLAHPIASTWWSRLRRKRSKHTPAPALSRVVEHLKVSVPQVNRNFGFTAQVRQTLAIAWSSFGTIVRSKAGLIAVGLLAVQMIVFAFEYLEFRGVPQYPTTINLLVMLTASLRDFQTPLIIIPMLIAFYAGELVWREREAGLNRISDTMPVSEWSLYLGKFFGLALIILVWLGFLMVAGIVIPVTMGYTNADTVVLVKALFGIQFTNYLLFALLALSVHVLVNQKYVGHVVIIMLYLSMVFAAKIGIEHNLLIYASDPGWSYTDMRGFGPYLGPWLWFKIYWVGWAILLAVVARLLWVRSMSDDLRMRMQLTRHRFTRTTALTTAVAVGVILFSGTYIFYNTNVLNNYTTASERTELVAQYELKYGKYKHIPQPLLRGTKLQVEIYPAERKADIQGTYTLVNKSTLPIDTVHLATIEAVKTGAIKFDRPFKRILVDEELGHSIYTLNQPLQPGDSLRLSFDVQYHVKGFPHKGIDASVIQNGTYFINYDLLPAIGYQAMRELRGNGERKKYGLGPWAIPSLYNSANINRVMPGQELINFEAVVSTAKGQVAIGPGTLLKKWTEKGRSYFHYTTSAPIRNNYSFFSAKYATHKATWKNPASGQTIAIRLYYHPEHGEHIGRMVKSIKDSFAYYTKKYGPYPYSHITIVERSGYASELNAEPTTVDYGESFTFSSLKDNPWALDLIYFPIAHEVAHQWWGAAQLLPAHVEGGIVVSETLANYSSLQLVEETYGKEHAKKLLDMWRKSYEVPRSRATAPLLQAADAFIGYRKGPLALHALTEYIGKDPVNDALRKLIEKYGSGKPPYATSLDLYRELKAATPDSLQYLLQDYFEKNVYWQLKTEQADAKQLDKNTWQVTLKVHAQKVVVDSTGAENPVPMNDWVEIGIFAPWQKDKKSDKPLYLRKHRIRSGKQTITINVAGKPARAGIDPNFLLIDLNLDNNTKNVKMEGDNKEEFELI
ncbi:ABC transporter permease/M1 family aminopeptidase [Pontibacter cellulosilyticus]|uniref:ABC transporter permease n=1 Tax=Pontibacter cellulosilyticus TaxID=1720253 RepID=A0A923SH82_9BACT|nr:ABC transporter permease subunit [Pontibacter cellulosilyticus]MBC5991464.1 ABC transporter permease [Pontibacter cellulosilyticus]